MSDYFDGLIRASGLAAGSYPPVATDHGITEIEIQHDAPPSATSPVTQVPRTNTQRTEIMTTPPVATTTVPASAIREDAAPPRTAYTELASDRPLPASLASPPDPRGETSMAPGLPTPSASASSPRPQETAPDPGQAMVHAALRWVVADVQSLSASTEIALTPEPAPPSSAQTLTTHKSTPPARPTVNLAEASQPVPGATTRPPEAPISLRVKPIRQPESTDRLPHTPIGALHPTAQEEVVEVSIGAIHLRIDAPPPQTVVQAPAPTPRPPADRPAPRSALSRRALRRL